MSLRQTRLGNLRVCSHTHMRAHLYLSVLLYVYTRNRELLLIFLVLVQYHQVLSASSFLIYNFSSRE